jgi:hypothetical protein
LFVVLRLSAQHPVALVAESMTNLNLTAMANQWRFQLSLEAQDVNLQFSQQTSLIHLHEQESVVVQNDSG